ncbi:hypothetical protein CAI21_12375 [Alkalilimnicola ehrlichii]|uniref:PRC-barrel domain-containing protein n=1 Tax=Alkalilimnicola ehrlichii TaxID=351052 RepID=A0A3E0X201_9GAMM|nr:PRC-barrel domain-containing protein [Alkalilimnicola ehrlichii]RFA28367.1 hypothetical protein CAI21_12375 [Alkalilimnicola ehrlichii]RFA38568.1 hypothetical protein CAL65_04285 [Alkalilimnicola ehrlichii]
MCNVWERMGVSKVGLLPAIVFIGLLLLPFGVQSEQEQADVEQEADEDTALFDDEHQLEPGAELSEMTVGALHGAEVVNTQGEVIGTVRDLAVSRSDEHLHAIVDVGGWLGIGGTQLAVPVEELEIRGEDQVAYLTNAGQEEIEEQAEDYDEDQFVSLGEEDMRLSVYMKGERRG